MSIELQDDGKNVKLTGDDLEAYLKTRFPEFNLKPFVKYAIGEAETHSLLHSDDEQEGDSI